MYCWLVTGFILLHMYCMIPLLQVRSAATCDQRASRSCRKHAVCCSLYAKGALSNTKVVILRITCLLTCLSACHTLLSPPSPPPQQHWTYSPLPEYTWYAQVGNQSEVLTLGNTTLWEMGNK
jgi:hypothetical protein